MARPSTERTLSSGLSPASAAAEPATTLEIVVLGPSATRPWPAMTMKKRRNAMIAFTVTPAITVMSRFLVEPCRNVRDSSAGSTSSRLLIPRMRT